MNEDLPTWAGTGKPPKCLPVSAAQAACQACGFDRCDRCIVTRREGFLSFGRAAKNWLTAKREAEPGKNVPFFFVRSYVPACRTAGGRGPLAVHQLENLARKPLCDVRGILTQRKLVPEFAPVDIPGLIIAIQPGPAMRAHHRGNTAPNDAA
jgi:hypothetical protein